MKVYGKYFALARIFAMVVLVAVGVKAYGQNTQSSGQSTEAGDGGEMEKLRRTVEAHPDDLSAHQAYIKAMKFDSPDLIKQYDEWIKEFPGSAIFPYAIGNALANRENPGARPYLLKAIGVDPKFDKAYFALWSDAQRWGEFETGAAYLKRAAELDPKNADYAFFFANSFAGRDEKKYKELSLKVAGSFPNTERGAQALYWLANRSQNPEEKIIYYEQQKKDFPVEQFNWTSYGMSDYFQLLLTLDAQKALALAEEIGARLEKDAGDKKAWDANIVLAKNIIRINSLLAEGKTSEAIALSNEMKVPRNGSAKEFIVFLKSKVLDAAGKSEEAYKNLLLAYAKEPSEVMNPLLVKYGKKLGKDPTGVNADIWHVRDTTAKQAPNFTLENYFTRQPTSLADYKGKVVLLTYWFPGCGPCRGEFPHFENVVKKFKGRNDFVYVGINIVPDQDNYVLPFVKSSGYSFIPLKDHKNWEKGPLDNRGFAPMNFLIDGNGRIVFSDFRTDESNEKTLETMIRSLLERKPAGKDQNRQGPGSKASINGKIHLKQPVEWIYLGYHLPAGSVRDSAQVVNGEFKFETSVGEPALADLWIYADKGKGLKYESIRVFLEPGNIDITIKDSLKGLFVSGSKAHQEYVKLNKALKPYDNRYAQLIKRFAEYRKNEKELNKTPAAWWQLNDEINHEVYTPYLQKNPTSPIAIYVVEKFIGSWIDIDLDRIEKAEKLFVRVSPSLKKWPSARDFARRLKAARNTVPGVMAMDFTLKDSTGNSISLSSFRGKYVLVDFWASWCGPCRANNPYLVKAYNGFKQKGFTVLGVAFDGGERLEKAWRKAMVDDGLPWVNVNDVKYPDDASVGKRYNVGSIPQNVLVDPTGKIIARNIEGEDLERKLKEILQ